jgi:hypothetical protein
MKRKENEKENKPSINLKGYFTRHLMKEKYYHILTSQVICLSVTIGPVYSLSEFAYFCYPK